MKILYIVKKLIFLWHWLVIIKFFVGKSPTRDETSSVGVGVGVGGSVTLKAAAATHSKQKNVCLRLEPENENQKWARGLDLAKCELIGAGSTPVQER